MTKSKDAFYTTHIDNRAKHKFAFIGFIASTNEAYSSMWIRGDRQAFQLSVLHYFSPTIQHKYNSSAYYSFNWFLEGNPKSRSFVLLSIQYNFNTSYIRRNK